MQYTACFLVSLAAVLSLSFLASPSVTIEASEIAPPPQTPLSLIDRYAALYGVSEQKMTATIRCESSFLHEGVYGDHGLAYGIAQFHKSTFDWMKGLAHKGGLRYESEEDQIELMAWAFSHGLAAHWSCYHS